MGGNEMIAGLKKARTSGGVEVVHIPNHEASQALVDVGGEVWGDYSTVTFSVASVEEIKSLVEKLESLGVDCRTIKNMIEDNHPIVAKSIS